MTAVWGGYPVIFFPEPLRTKITFTDTGVLLLLNSLSERISVI